MTPITTKRRLMLFMMAILCIPVMVLGCGGVDMSSPRSTVKGYIEAMEDYDYDKMAEYMGQEGISLPKGPDLEFRDVMVGVTSQTEVAATVYAQWSVWVEYEGTKLPAEAMQFEFHLIKMGDDWIILDLEQLNGS